MYGLIYLHDVSKINKFRKETDKVSERSTECMRF